MTNPIQKHLNKEQQMFILSLLKYGLFSLLSILLGYQLHWASTIAVGHYSTISFPTIGATIALVTVSWIILSILDGNETFKDEGSKQEK
jgi:uncharacterized membrane protein (DUF485 family)